MTIRQILLRSKNELETKMIAEPKNSAEILMCQVLNQTKSELYASFDRELTPKELKKYREYISRRLNHEPVWQIIGKVKFGGLDFFIDKNVLVPRPETELLVQEVLKKVQIKNQNLKILDIGTGSGAIAITLAHLLSLRRGKVDAAIFPFVTPITNAVIPAKAGIYKSKTALDSRLRGNDVEIVATDVSEKAIKIAKKNAKRLKVQKIVKFKKSDLFSKIEGKFDIIVANLPYVPHEEMNSLAVDLLHYEPRIALDGGKNGLEIYEKFLKELPNHVETNSIIFCEIGINQGKEFARLVKKYLPKSTCTIKNDFADIDRIAIIKLGEQND